MSRAALELIPWRAEQPDTYDMAKPWDRQPFDTDEVWAAYRAYLVQPLPRSLSTLHRQLGCTELQCQSWARRGAFERRAQLFDNHLHETFKQNVYAYADKVAEHYTKRHIALLTRAEELAFNELEKFIETSRSTERETIKLSDLIKLTENMVKLQRLLHDESTENISAQVKSFDATKLTLTEIRAMKLLNEKAKVDGS